jgi:CRISPR/Cas system-associated endoribonuclease Cas2
MRIRRSKRIVAGSLTCEDRMIRVQRSFFWIQLAAYEHVKAERIFSNVKNIAFRLIVQADS